MDTTDLSSYRPISNLPVLSSTIICKIDLSQLLERFFLRHNIICELQTVDFIVQTISFIFTCIVISSAVCDSIQKLPPPVDPEVILLLGPL